MKTKTIKKMNDFLKEVGEANSFKPIDNINDIPAEIALSLFTGFCFSSFGEIHKYFEKVMGRPIWTSEMGDSNLWLDVADNIINLCLNKMKLSRLDSLKYKHSLHKLRLNILKK